MIQEKPAGDYRRWRQSLFVNVLGAGLLWPVCGIAQTAPSAAPASSVTAKPAAKPSLGHAMAKGITLKIATAGVLSVIYLAGTGSVIDAGVLTAISTAGSYAIYVANDYLWDYFSPNTNISANNPSFDTSASLWRNTGKYLTFKPVVASFSWGLVYAYTGSVNLMLTMGSAGTIAIPLIFYANNVGWDWYDWYAAPTSVAR